MPSFAHLLTWVCRGSEKDCVMWESGGLKEPSAAACSRSQGHWLMGSTASRLYVSLEPVCSHPGFSLLRAAVALGGKLLLEFCLIACLAVAKFTPGIPTGQPLWTWALTLRGLWGPTPLGGAALFSPAADRSQLWNMKCYEKRPRRTCKSYSAHFATSMT